MGKLLVGLLIVASLAAAAALVPLRGRTVWQRWCAARGARDFVERGYREARAAAGLEPERRPARARPVRPARTQERPARPAMPTEDHSRADRAALDRIIAEHGER